MEADIGTYRVLDAEIARKVMGAIVLLAITDETKDNDYPYDYHYLPRDDPFGVGKRLERFSTNVTDAFLVVDRLYDLGIDRFILTRTPELPLEWNAQFWKQTWNTGPGFRKTDYYGSNSSILPAHAICTAALESVSKFILYGPKKDY